MKTLLHTCRTACDEITPFIEAVYATLNKDPNSAVLKADKSYFSLADGVVQVSSIPMLRHSNPCAHQMQFRMMTNNFDERC